jgi:CRISPR system Cascade subunit CasE
MIRLSKATYEGILRVTDKDLFYHTLTDGIGKKKAYGFGLMTVIPE